MQSFSMNKRSRFSSLYLIYIYMFLCKFAAHTDQVIKVNHRYKLYMPISSFSLWYPTCFVNYTFVQCKLSKGTRSWNGLCLTGKWAKWQHFMRLPAYAFRGNSNIRGNSHFEAVIETVFPKYFANKNLILTYLLHSIEKNDNPCNIKENLMMIPWKLSILCEVRIRRNTFRVLSDNTQLCLKHFCRLLQLRMHI